MLLNNNQQEVVECLDHCLAVAGPGSGKTRVIVNKVEYILKHDPNAMILIVTFTQDSAAEIRRRIIELVPNASKKVASGTFHSLAFDQLKRGKDGKGTDGFKGSVLSPGETKSYVARALTDAIDSESDPEIKKLLLEVTPDEASGLIEELKMIPGYIAKNDAHGNIFAAYNRLTERSNVMDFADMLSRAVRLMRAGELLPKKCTYLFTDESQDLDEMQYAWCEEHLKDGAKITVVGDDDQSIYKFRRALGFKGMTDFQKKYSATKIMLDTNYRCRSEILDAAAKVIEHNKERVEKNLKSHRGPGGLIQIWQCNTPGEEANLVVDTIKRISAKNKIPDPLLIKRRMDDGKFELDENGNPISDQYVFTVGIEKQEWAVLARNNQNLHVLAAAMKSHGIPHKFTGTNLWSEQPICFVLALLVSIATSQNEVSIKRQQAGYDAALHYIGLDESAIENLHQDCNGDFNTLIFSKISEETYGRGTAQSINDFSKMVKDWQRSLNYGRYSNLINGVFDWFIRGVYHFCGNDKKIASKAEKMISQLKSCNEIFVKLDGSILSRIRQILSPIDGSEDDKKNKKSKLLAEKTGEIIKNEDLNDDYKERRVILGTMHSSKGLEFQNVWLFAIEDGVIPSSKALEPRRVANEQAPPLTEHEIQQIIEEERRLFYVGMTRAKDRLFISNGKKPSMFIEETGIPIRQDLGPQCIEYNTEIKTD